MSINHHQDFIHIELNVEVVAIGGHYVFTKEVHLPFKDQKVLYLAGYARFDTSCCGSGGCGYALVPGFIRNWKYTINTDGCPISEVGPITDPNLQKQIACLIKKIESVVQVLFL